MTIMNLHVKGGLLTQTLIESHTICTCNNILLNSRGGCVLWAEDLYVATHI